MERLRPGSELYTLTSLVVIPIVMGTLYFGKEILVPFALALLLSFVLTPAVVLLERLRFGRVPSVLLVLTISVSVAVVILWLGTTQLTDIVTNLPLYQQNITKKIQAMRNPAGYGLTKALDGIQQLSNIFTQGSVEKLNIPSEPKNSPRSGRPSTQQQGPITVEVKPPSSGIAESLQSVGSPLLHCLEEAVAVLIFTLFMLMQRGDLRNRLFRLFGERHLNLMTTAMDDAAHRVSRYLLTQSIINGVFGLILGSGLYFLGVPNALFWGVLGSILRFIPYVGTLVAGLCPLVLALAVFEGWEKPMLTLSLFASVELLLSAAIEPWLYGAHTGISSLAILVSAAFWTLLWGPIGLVLSTPLTVCLVVLGRYAPPLKFLSFLLSDEPVLPLEARFYQRLLAMDEEEAQDLAERYLREKTVAELYDCVLVPALSLAERDRHQNALDAERESFIYGTTRNLINDLSEQDHPRRPKSDSDSVANKELSIFCIPARDEADELVCSMLCWLLRASGFQVQAVPIGTVESMLTSVRERQPDILFVSALPPFGVSQTRSLCRKIRSSFPNLRIVVGFWASDAETEKIQERLGPACFDQLVTSLRQAEAQVRIYSEFGKAVKLSPASSDVSSLLES